MTRDSLADEWTKLTSLPGKYEADLLVGRLKEAGIQARTGKSPKDPAGWLTAYGSSGGPFDVYVPAAKTGVARQLLVESSPSGHPSEGRLYHRLVQVVGRGLILAGILALIATLLLQALR